MDIDNDDPDQFSPSGDGQHSMNANTADNVVTLTFTRSALSTIPAGMSHLLRGG